MKCNRRITALCLLTISTLISCSEKDKTIQCGCEGGTVASVKSDPGIVVKVVDGADNGFHFLSLSYGYFDFCDPVPSELQIDGLQVRISGTTKIPCTVSKSPVLQVQHYPFRLSNYSIATDSLFVGNPVTIKLFPYQSPESTGYGYSISTSSGFKIVQEIIPVIGGLNTFSTQTKAFKVAVLVGHKIMVGDGLPTLVYADLTYLDALN